MTIQLPELRVADADVRRPQDRRVRWLTPVAGLWVGSANGDHAGMVERVDGTYQATDGRGRSVGSFPDLEPALAAVESGEERREDTRRGVRSALWAVNLVAAGAATALAIALIR